MKLSALWLVIFLATHSEIIASTIDSADSCAFFRIKNETDIQVTNRLYISFWNQFLSRYSVPDTIFYVNRDRNNGYFFKISPVKHLSRISIKQLQIATDINSQFLLIEPGDSITMTIKKDGSVSFTGRGCSKYNYLKITGFDRQNRQYEQVEQPFLQIKNRDSIVSRYLRLVEKCSVSKDVKALLALEYTAKIYTLWVANLTHTYPNADSLNKIAFDSLLNLPDKIGNIPDSIILLSNDYIGYLYEKEKSKLILMHSVNQPTIFRTFAIKDLYDRIKTNYAGLLREKLLTYCLLNSWDIDTFFNGVDAEQYTEIIEDAIGLIETLPLKQALLAKLHAKGKGYPAYDFALTDSSGKIVHLHDFKGKVAFIDIWANPCGACPAFKRNFEKYVYPAIKNNPDVIVVSIALNDRSKWLEKVNQFSNPDFINLYVGDLGLNHPLAIHYDITVVPHLLVVDRQGNIFFATISSSSSSGNSEMVGRKILDLINGALMVQ